MATFYFLAKRQGARTLAVKVNDDALGACHVETIARQFAAYGKVTRANVAPKGAFVLSLAEMLDARRADLDAVIELVKNPPPPIP